MKSNRPNLRTFTLIWTAAAVLGTVHGPSEARAASADAYAGTWKYAATKAEEDARKRAVDAAIKGLPRFAQKKARNRINEQTKQPADLKIAVEGSKVDFSRDGRSVSLEIGGAPTTMEGGKGTAKLSARMDDGHLVMVSEGEKGKRTTIYKLSSDNKSMTISTNMTGSRLSEPVKFDTTYQRR